MAVMGTKAAAKPKSRNVVGTWAAVTVLGAVVYVVVDAMLALLRPDYSLLHNAESDYGRGPFFWLMDGNFLLRCLLSLTLVRALFVAFPKNKALKHASFWLIIWAVASGLLAFFADNPYGYPKLRSGSVHQLLAVIDFVAIMVGMILVTRRLAATKQARTVTYTLTSLTVIAFLALVLLKPTHFQPHALGGLYERIFLGSVLLWEAVIAAHLWMNSASRVAKGAKTTT